MSVSFFWFRRDLRLKDNVALNKALQSGQPVQCLFIFDQQILEDLPKNDARVSFIYDQLDAINTELNRHGGSLILRYGKPFEVWKELISEFDIKGIYLNRDYEPYALRRDRQIQDLASNAGIAFETFKDQVMYEMDEILKDDGLPYTVYTPYKNKWRLNFTKELINEYKVELSLDTINPLKIPFPELDLFGFRPSDIKVRPYTLHNLKEYAKTRDLPAKNTTSYLSVHLRFGTVSVREIIRQTWNTSPEFINELIWREFFMLILYHFPKVVTNNFRSKYDGIKWRNNEGEFKRWCEGKTGYPMVDAGMRQLNSTGYMHNRVRMITASFLCKHLLIDWRWGEAYFAEKLLDYELSSNNGNWQWAAGTGCDAAPYFRIFNPDAQQKKFDPELIYIRKWIKDFDELTYPQPMVDHKFARERALQVYKASMEN